MNIDIEYFEEPKLEFGDYFEHEDSKTGLAEYGPYGQNISGFHPPLIRLGYVGTRETVSGAQEWISHCSSYIESENIDTVRQDYADLPLLTPLATDEKILRRVNKILNRDFVGFNRNSTFNSEFQSNPLWVRYINSRELEIALRVEDKQTRILRIADLVENAISSISQTAPTPDIIIVALTTEIAELADRVRIAGNFYLDLRRELKARAMRQQAPIPIQIIRRRTIEGKSDVEEVSIRAWNFCTAQYYKAGGIPWHPTSLPQDTCWIGISFYVAHETDENLSLRSSVAQAFDYLGQGLVLRGEQFEWDQTKYGRTPHLTSEQASRLIQNTLNEYVGVKGTPPSRVVVHKTSEYWDHNHGEFNEIDGFHQGIDTVFRGCEADFVALRQTGVRLFREGRYPPLRGTYFCIENTQHFLYTMGYIPYLETYPRSYVPEPWQITQHIGPSSPKDLMKEVLALTKMNVNNCSYADGVPITLSFSRKVGEIMKHVPEDGIIQPHYRFYM